MPEFTSAGVERDMLWSLIDNYENEERITGRELEDLRRQRASIASQLEMAAEELKGLKMARLSSEEETRNVTVRFDILEAALELQEEKASKLQQQIDEAAVKLENLKEEYTIRRDAYIAELLKLNCHIREAQSGTAATKLGNKDEKADRRGNSLNPKGKFSPDKPAAKEKPGDDGQLQEVDRAAGSSKDVSLKLHQLEGAITTDKNALLKLQEETNTRTENLKKLLSRKTKVGEDIEEVKNETAKLRSESEDLEGEVALLTSKLRNAYECPECGAGL